MLMCDKNDKTRHTVDYLSEVVGGIATHVVVNSWQYWHGFSRHINSSKDHCRFRDARELRKQLLRRQVRHCQIDVGLILATTSAMMHHDY